MGAVRTGVQTSDKNIIIIHMKSAQIQSIN